MNIFLLNFILTIFWRLTFYKTSSNALKKKNQTDVKIFIILLCVQWILISGLRSDYVGSDTSNYTNMFLNAREMSWSEIKEVFIDYYTNSESKSIEPAFIVFEKLVGMFTDSEVVYKFVVAIIFMSALGVYIYRNSTDPFISFLLYDALFYNMFSLTGYRQVVSVAIAILWGFEFVKQRKFWPFLVLVLIGSLFHRSTLVFLPFYFIAYKKITPIYIISALGAIILMIIFREKVFEFIKGIAGYEEYGNYGFAQQNFTLMFGGLTFLSILQYPKIKKMDENAVVYYNGLIMSYFMLPFAMVSPTSMRLVYNFAFVLLLLLPLIIKSFNINNDETLLNVAVIVIFAYFIATKTPYYEFFWQA